MNSRRVEFSKYGKSARQFAGMVRAVNWNRSDAFSRAKSALEGRADLICETLLSDASENGYLHDTFIRNLVAESKARELPAWTAFLYYVAFIKNPPLRRLKKESEFLTQDPKNCGLLFQLLSSDAKPSLESIVSFFEDDPAKGLALAFRTLSGQKKLGRLEIVNRIKSLHTQKSALVSPENIISAWRKHKLPRLEFDHLMKLPAPLRKSILSNRHNIESILDVSAIEHIKSNPESCRQSPLFAFLHLKGEGGAQRRAMGTGNWSHPGIPSLITVFLTQEVEKEILSICREKGFGKPKRDHIQAMQKGRLRNALRFSAANSIERMSFFEQLPLREQVHLTDDIHRKYWADSFLKISGIPKFKSVFEKFRKAGLLEAFLKGCLSAPGNYPVRADRISLIGAANFGFFDIVMETLLASPLHYRKLFAEKDPAMVKAVLASAENDDQLKRLIRALGQIFLKCWIESNPVEASTRLALLTKDSKDPASAEIRTQLTGVVTKISTRQVKTVLKYIQDAELLETVFNATKTEDAGTLKTLLDLQNAEGIPLWEEILLKESGEKQPPSLLNLIVEGKRSVLKRAYELQPGMFYKTAVKRLPLKMVLPTAFRHPLSGFAVERKYARPRLMKELGWVQDTFKGKPTVSTAYEAALTLSVPDAAYILYLATLKWKDRKNEQAGHKFDHLYKTHSLPKKSGGKRLITAPDPKLKRLQRRFLRNGIQNIPVHPAAHGFLKDHSIVTNAKEHTGRELVVNMDIAGFFPNTGYKHIVQACKKIAKGKLSIGAVMLVSDICSYDGGLPTGAPTSPHLGNVVLHSADKAILKVSERHGINYTRYADDMTFSGDDGVKRIIPFVSKVLSEKGYRLDPKKTNLFRRGRRQMVTGLVVNEKPNLPRHIRKKIRAAAHRMHHGDTPHWHGKPVSGEKIMGLIAHLNAASPDEAARYKAQAKSGKGV